jgi:hypothetical protein
VLTQRRVRDVLHYNPWTGALTWRHRLGGSRSWNARFAGKKAGAPHGDGYIAVAIDGVRYLAHRLIWFYVFGYWPDEVDHEDQSRSHNRLDNLREVTRLENAKNHTLQRNNTSGHVGVSLIKSTGRWRAYYYVSKRQVEIGVFANRDDAIEARKAANDNNSFHANHGRAAA